MPKYTVILTRGVTESTTVEVEAATPDEAETAAHVALNQAENSEWEIDDGSWNNSDVYVTDVSKIN